MKTKQQMYNRFLHHNMAIVGGFLAGYAVLIHSNFLGNAQTSNLIFFVFSILKRDPLQALLRFLGVLLYASGGIAFVFVKNKTKYDVRAVSMIITSLMILLSGCFRYFWPWLFNGILFRENMAMSVPPFFPRIIPDRYPWHWERFCFRMMEKRE